MPDNAREVKAPASIREPFQNSGFRNGDTRFAADIVEYEPDDPKVRATQGQLDLVPEPQGESDGMRELVAQKYRDMQLMEERTEVTPTPTTVSDSGEIKVIL